MASGELESGIVGPLAPHEARRWQVFCFTALGIGLTPVFLILHAAIFAYRQGI